jgi:hypothetical protein
MISSENEIRVGLQAILATVLVFYGLYGCAVIVGLTLLPWKPFLEAGAYLVQPVIDWRAQRECARLEQRTAPEDLESVLVRRRTDR